MVILLISTKITHKWLHLIKRYDMVRASEAENPGRKSWKVLLRMPFLCDMVNSSYLITGRTI